MHPRAKNPPPLDLLREARDRGYREGWRDREVLLRQAAPRHHDWHNALSALSDLWCELAPWLLLVLVAAFCAVTAAARW